MAKLFEKVFSPIFVVLLPPLILIFHQFNYFRSLLLYPDAYLLFGIYLAAPIILYILIRKVLKVTPTLTGLLTLTLSAFYFFFGAVQDALLSNSATAVISKTYLLIPLFLLPAVYLLFKKPELKTTFRFLTVALTAFLLTEVFNLLFVSNADENTITIAEPPLLNASVGAEKDSLSVYHFIFDGYTNSKTLLKNFGFSNSLDSFLLSQEFFVAQETKSNYNFTPLSIGATLNLSYLNITESQLKRNYKNYLLGAKLFSNNQVFNFFRNRGYAVSCFSILNDYEYLDKLGTFVPKTPVYAIRNQTLERVFLNPWIWEKLKRSEKGKLPTAIQKSLKQFKVYNDQALKNALVIKPKAYNFAHFLIPHEPYIYSKRSIDSLTEPDLMDHQVGYVKQVQYVNDVIKKLVAELRQNPNNIIIIQGDHGFREYADTENPMRQLETLNAIYFPGKQYHLLYDSISLVNTYRVVLRQFFHQPIPLLKDRYALPKN